MEFEVEVEEMFKGLPSDLADGPLADVCKDSVQELGRQRGANASKTICAAGIIRA